MNVFSVVAVLGVVAFIGLLAYLREYDSKAGRARRALRSAKGSSISDAVEGKPIKLTGTVRCLGEPLKAPFSGRLCACWEVLVREYIPSQSSGSWRDVMTEQDAQHFIIENETGRVLVKAIDPHMALKAEEISAKGPVRASSEIKQFLVSRGHSTDGLLGMARDLKYHEGVIEAGEKVSVSGIGRWETDPFPTKSGEGYRDTSKWLVLEGTDETPVLVSDQRDVVERG